MKLSHLSLAIFTAISLAACGGSGSDNAVDNSQTPAPTPKPADKDKKPDQTDQKIVDPTQTGVVGDLDFNTESSVGTTQYIRADKSKFDRDNNPSEAASATAILGVTLNKQNPWLSNIALAQLKTKDGKATLVQYLGNPPNDVANLSSEVSLQSQNKLNVDLQTGDLTVIGSNDTDAIEADAVKDQLDKIKELIAAYETTANTGSLTTTQAERLAELQELATQYQDLYDKIDDDEFGKNRLALDENTSYKWGDKVPTTDMAKAATAGSGPEALGLVGVNYEAQTGVTKPGDVQGEEADSKSSTRIFGRTFNTDGTSVEQNSYLGAEAILLTGGNTDFASPASTDATGADTAYEDAKKAKKNAPKYTLAAIPNKLADVQYGRVTGNLDPLKLTKAEIKKGGLVYKQSPYLTKGSKQAVDTYFYRGTNATTVEQMADLPKGKELTYKGHALMYGLDNSFHGNVGDSVPSAFGQNNAHAIGNFVIAKVDLDKATVKGSVYNQWQQEGSPETYADALVGFDGNIFGNTILGEAQRVYNTSDKADFRASFFGKTGEELGGSINSITWQERYGQEGDAWGGVFGASRVEEISALTNQWLGDIPAITQSTK